jgi:hypothetical protein
MIRYLPGKLNVIADYLSRLHLEQEEENTVVSAITTQTSDTTDNPLTYVTKQEIFSQVHGGRNGHFGVSATWKDLNTYFPGHNISIQLLRDMIAECPTCQKDRLLLSKSTTLAPIKRNLHCNNWRAVVGVDLLTITPPDDNGNKTCIVITNHFTKFSYGYAINSKDANTIAGALFKFYVTFGYYDTIMSDPGSEFLNDTVTCLNRLFGIRHVVSLVDVHTSNGVEGTNKQILRHLRALLMDERVGKK